MRGWKNASKEIWYHRARKCPFPPLYVGAPLVLLCRVDLKAEFPFRTYAEYKLTCIYRWICLSIREWWMYLYTMKINNTIFNLQKSRGIWNGTLLFKPLGDFPVFIYQYICIYFTECLYEILWCPTQINPWSPKRTATRQRNSFIHSFVDNVLQ